VFNPNGERSLTLDLSYLETGMYLVEVKGETFRVIKKLLKN